VLGTVRRRRRRGTGKEVGMFIAPLGNNKVWLSMVGG